MKATKTKSAARVEPGVEAYRPPYLGAVVAGLAVFTLYAITLARTTVFWDASEYIATAHIMGIPHPPGNPLFVVFARAWELLLAPTGLSVAVRINLFSAFMGAAAHGFWFLVAHRVLAFYSPNRVFRLVGAAAAVAISAAAFTVWNHSNVNEKVYTVSLFTIALLSWLAFHWRDASEASRSSHLGKGKDDNIILLMVFILALSVGNHLMAFLAAPALAVFILLVEPRTFTNWRLYAGAAVVAVLGLSIHLFLPLRASLGPVINEADPSTWQALWDSLMRRQYAKPSMLANPIDPRIPRDGSLFMAQIGNYLQYFDWQWARSVAGNVSVFGGARPLFTLLFSGLGIYGAVTHYRKDRTSWSFIAVLFATLSLGLVVYLNFKYGYAWARDRFPDPMMHEVRERDYFFIVSFSVWGVWAGIGLAALWQRLADTLARRNPGPRALALSAPILAIALIPLALNYSWATRHYDYSARDWAYNLLQSVEPYGVLITNGDNDTFPLWYLQEVEGIRRDVTVIVMSYLNTPWYAKQLKELTTPCADGQDWRADPTLIICQRDFEPEKAPAFYSARSVPADAGTQPVDTVIGLDQPPTRSIFDLSDEEIDSLTTGYAANPSAYFVRQPLQVTADSLTFVVPGEQMLTPADVLLLHIVQNALGDRPIYFASTTQAYEIVGLRPFLVRQGLALKLINGEAREDAQAGIYAMPVELSRVIGPYMDLPRTDELLDEVFMFQGGIPDQWTHWVDAPTQGIPYYYAITHFAAAQLHALHGDSTAADRHLERYEAWMKLSQR